MNRVQQKDSNGCVVASLSMLTGDDYDDVRSAFKAHDFTKNGVSSEFEGCNYLTQRGFAYQKMYRHDSLTRTDREKWPLLWSSSSMLVGYMAQVELNGMVHAIVVKPDGWVLDPWRDGIYRLEDYAKVNHLIAVYRVTDCAQQANGSTHE
jgi:hypothetical protein